jgi:hypothetical protein
LELLTGEKNRANDSKVDVWVVGTACIDADDGDVTDFSANLDVLAHRAVRP